LENLPSVSPAPGPVHAAAEGKSWLRRLLARMDAVFIVTVLVPTLLAVVYFGFVASDVYVSESRFVVRTPQRPAQTGLGALLQGTVFSRSQDDTYSVHDFIRSRDALRELEERLKLREAYSAPEIDVVNRFPGLTPWEDSFEAFFRYYQGRVSITYDAASSISVLKVHAFDATKARQVNEALLEMGERLVNQMNLRSRQDLITVAEQEVKVAETRAQAAAAALSVFRADRGVFDPDRQSTLQLQGVAKLREELLAARTQLDQVRQVSPNNPQLGVLRSRVEALERAVAAESAQVTGRQSGLSRKSPEFDRLTLEKTFADRQLAATLAALDNARSEASRKQLYLERLVEPNLPDDALEPRRIRSIVTTLVIGLVLWGTLSLVLASVREHAE
jgi:capsular polysaccharide transport system permease protein